MFLLQPTFTANQLMTQHSRSYSTHNYLATSPYEQAA